MARALVSRLEHRWSVRRDSDGATRWFRPDRTGYRAGPSPPAGDAADEQLLLSAAG